MTQRISDDEINRFLIYYHTTSRQFLAFKELKEVRAEIASLKFNLEELQKLKDDLSHAEDVGWAKGYSDAVKDLK